MPTNPPGGGTTTSFSNTPQAVDDHYTAIEDGGLAGVYKFDVMSNDLGGSAKTLWSIDDTTTDGSTLAGPGADGTIDLLAKDVVGVSESSDLGARISITTDGKIAYDTNSLEWLAAAQTVTDKFTYAIRLANGTLSWATVYVTVTGSNDGPVMLAGGKAAAAVTEDSSV